MLNFDLDMPLFLILFLTEFRRTATELFLKAFAEIACAVESHLFGYIRYCRTALLL